MRCARADGQIIDSSILCVHGGLSPDLRTLDQVRIIPRAQEIPHEGAFCGELCALCQCSVLSLTGRSHVVGSGRGGRMGGEPKRSRMAFRRESHCRSEYRHWQSTIPNTGECGPQLTAVQPRQRLEADSAGSSARAGGVQVHVRRISSHSLVGAKLLLSVWQFGVDNAGGRGFRGQVQGVRGGSREQHGPEEPSIEEISELRRVECRSLTWSLLLTRRAHHHTSSDMSSHCIIDIYIVTPGIMSGVPSSCPSCRVLCPLPLLLLSHGRRGGLGRSDERLLSFDLALLGVLVLSIFALSSLDRLLLFGLEEVLSRRHLLVELALDRRGRERRVNLLFLGWRWCRTGVCRDGNRVGVRLGLGTSSLLPFDCGVLSSRLLRRLEVPFLEFWDQLRLYCTVRRQLTRQEPVPAFACELRVLGELPTDHELLDTVDGVNVVHAVDDDPSDLFQALERAHGGYRVSLHHDVALGEELNGL